MLAWRMVAVVVVVVVEVVDDETAWARSGCCRYRLLVRCGAAVVGGTGGAAGAAAVQADALVAESSQPTSGAAHRLATK